MKKADGSAAGSSQKSSAKKQRFGLPQGELHSLSYIIARAGRIVKKESQIRKAGRKKVSVKPTGADRAKNGAESILLRAKLVFTYSTEHSMAAAAVQQNEAVSLPVQCLDPVPLSSTEQKEGI